MITSNVYYNNVFEHKKSMFKAKLPQVTSVQLSGSIQLKSASDFGEEHSELAIHYNSFYTENWKWPPSKHISERIEAVWQVINENLNLTNFTHIRGLMLNLPDCAFREK